MAQELTDVARDRRALEIFAQACGLPPSDREALLAELCADDSAVRRRVEAMLAADGSCNGGPVGAETQVDHFVTRQIQGITSAEGNGFPPTAAPAVDGQYTLLRVIGEGGMGTVYEAEQHHPRRRVAIKAIRPGRITPHMSKRFEYEAQVLARLEHRGIARLYESNTQSEDGHVRAYLAMELVEGVPIDAYCTANQLPNVDRLRLFMKVCDAVSYAHRMGVIHRDLKPANILVNSDGEPKVLDFGVARTVGNDNGGGGATLLTHHGQIVGTLGYMSPEQVEGRDSVDTRADVYSLGVILYKLLTGLLPIDVGKDSLIEATRRILVEAPKRIGDHDRRLKGDLEVVVCRALEKEPARRYASVDQLRDELDRHLNGRPIEARADSSLYVFRKAVWRHRGPVGVGLLLLVLLTAFGVVASLQAGQSRRLAVAANAARDAAVVSESRATERAEQLRRLLYFSDIGFAQSALANNDMERAYTLLEGCDRALREWEWSYLQRLLDLSGGSTPLGLNRPRYASFTRDRSRLALASLDREVTLLDPAAGYRELFRERVSGGTARAAVSPDGRWLAFGGEVDRVVLVELATGTRRALAFEGPPVRDERRIGLRFVQFTPDSRTLLTGGTDQVLRVWDASSATAPPRAAIPLGEPQMPICLQLSNDGASAFAGDSRGGLRQFDLRTGKLLHSFDGHDAPVWALALSRDGKWLASGDNDSRVIIWDLATGKSFERISANDGWVTALCFSPDASRLAIGRADSIVRLQDLAERSVSNPVLRGHRKAVVHIDWQDDDSLHTVSLDGTLKTWDADSALQVPTIDTKQKECIGLAFDRYADHVYVGGADGTVRSWNLTGEDALHPVEARRFADHQAPVLEIAVDPVSGRVCTAGRDGVIRISRPDDNAPPLVITPGTGLVSAVDFSPDGSRLIVGTDGGVSLWDANTGAKLRDLSAPKLVANELRFDRNGTHFYGACVDGHLRRWSLDSPQPVAEVMVDPNGLYDVQLSPDGTRLLVAGDTQCVALFEADTLAEVRRYVGNQGVVLAVAFHPGGRRVAAGGSDGSIRIWDVDAKTELISLRGHRRRIEQLAFSPDGRTLASSSDDGTVKLWRTVAPGTPR